MKHLSFILPLCLVTFWSTAQNIDISEFSQNIALQDTTQHYINTGDVKLANYPSISETYQIPAYGLYNEYWDVQNLRSQLLTIPFSDERIMLLLVQQGNNSFVPPCVFDAITLPFGLTKKGDFHPGIDLKVEPQTLVKSCFDGVVRMAKYYHDYGLTVVIRHYNGLETVYAHLDKLCVKPGQMVEAGSIIGQTGKSGNATDYLLHFEVRFMNEYFNPEMMIDFDNDAIIKNTLVLMPADFRITSLDEIGKVVTKRPEPRPSTTTPSTPSTGNEEEQYHIVQKGETLYRIALNYGTTTEKIMQLNNIQNADIISEGKRLRIK